MRKEPEIKAIPINAIKQILKRKITAPISKKALVQISEHVEKYIQDIGNMALGELILKNNNPNRPKHYIYSKIDREMVKRAINRLRNGD